MLASITPLGERSRGNRYWLTVGAFIAGAAAGGVLLGGALGLLGSPLALDARTALVVAGCLSVVACLSDTGRLPWPLPTTRRQVNAMWIDTYRGGIYGFGFGVQLGVAVVTIVTSALTYLWMVIAVLLGSPAVGAILGVAFGLVRGLAILPSARVTSGRHFGELAATLARVEPTSRRAGLAVQLALPAAVIFWLIQS